ncbi:NADH:flavin oxidoreductase/NADH oxidase family protein [Pseudoduganella ginsengisoli]|uniref:NADH oxidase n=1 Tax=Pseudoduganella ginsengisoli TaxID=1462440 RepID=A0A6L6Q196_9BURK|nr:NADH:flavin oxidoreductase/NADH oxidase family protein [Pseudoduganella ginsengisoli]MTW03415.1 NADH oxidase [Pseudoduganella ginsengisoli]
MNQTVSSRAGAPFTLANGVVVKNRVAKGAMSEQLANGRHDPTEKLERLYRVWAENDIGLLISGNIMIDRGHLGEAKNVVLDDSSDLAAFRRWTAAGRAHGTQFWAQLNHPGKQTPKFLTKEPVAPSAIALGGGLEQTFNTPRAMTDAEIAVVIGKFARSALLAKEVGFTGVQIHGAHGYLVSQFLSPLHNQRTDRWGGSAENRLRFVVELYRAIRTAVGKDFPVGIKLNSADFQKGGFSEEESMHVVQALAREGIDMVEISGGTYESPAMVGAPKEPLKASTQQREAYFLAYAEKVRKLVTTPLMVTGGFRSSAGVEAALASGATDFIGLARPLAVEPALATRLINDPGYRIDMKMPTTGSKLVDHMTFLAITWYEHQLARMGNGKKPLPNMNAWRSVAATLWALGTLGFAKRRA